MREKIFFAIEESKRALCALESEENIDCIQSAARKIAEAFRMGNKLLIAGNGGSLCDAMHFAEELTGFYRGKRDALPAIALSDPGHMSCVGNDVGYDHVFSRGIEALGKEGDIFVAFTTSGNSENLVKAVEKAKEKGLFTLLFLGRGGGRLKGQGDLELHIDEFPFSDRIQEAHMMAVHLIIELVESELFPLEKVLIKKMR